jgi:hypothetical protein
MLLAGADFDHFSSKELPCFSPLKELYLALQATVLFLNQPEEITPIYFL